MEKLVLLDVPLMDHEFSEDFMEYVKLAVIEGAGHLPSMERPEETVALVRRFLG